MNNETLFQFLSLKEQISALEKQLEPIKKQIEAAGSLETDQFTVKITQVEQNRVVDCGTLLERLGPVKVTELELIKISSYNKVVVKQKLIQPKAG